MGGNDSWIHKIMRLYKEGKSLSGKRVGAEQAEGLNKASGLELG